MRTIEMQVFTFDELNEKAKQTALNDNRQINTTHGYNWWEYIYEDAYTIGLTIKSFDFDGIAEGELNVDLLDSILLIQENHGEICDTYKLALKFKKKWSELSFQFANVIETEGANQEEFKDATRILKEAYTEELCAEYLTILKNECEYLESDVAIQEAIEANGYEFKADGKIYN
jgi:hypothetical protein